MIEVPGRLASLVATRRFAVTAEVAPPLSADPAAVLAKARPLAGLADAVNVTDGASARVAMSSLAASAILAANGIEPVLQLTCRDRNRIALQADLLGAAALGVRNVLVLRGDDPAAGDQPDAKPVFDLDTRSLIAAAARMVDPGVLPSGRTIAAPPRLLIGAADTPGDPDRGWKPDALRAKAEAGARFVQTQFCFDVGLVRRYGRALAEAGLADRLAVLVGIGPIPSARSALWMRANLWGTVIPDEIVARLDNAASPEAEGVALCVELMEAFATMPGIAGVHLMAPRNEAGVPRAIAAFRGRAGA